MTGEVAGAVVPVSDGSYAEVVQRSSLPVLLCFGARWLGPWQVLLPHLEVVAHKLECRLRVAVVDCDLSWSVTQAHAVFSYPTTLLLAREDGVQREVARMVGPRTARELLTLVAPYVGGES